MTSKQLIDTLMNIQEYCSSNSRCERCQFYIKYHDINDFCQIRSVLKYLVSDLPRAWKRELLEVEIYE